MTVTKVTLTGTGSPLDPYSHAVYTKTAWSDEWTLQPTLHCDEAVWSVAPSIPVATLHQYYGDIAREGSLQFAKETRSSLLRAFVKIVFQVDGGTQTWYGVIEVDENELHGVVMETAAGLVIDVTATGEQTFTAYGLEQLLANHLVTTSVIYTSTGDTEIVARGITFNEGGKPNASTYAFSDDPDTVSDWTSRTIVQYLLDYQTPQDRHGVVHIPFHLPWESLRKIPNWDRPELPQHHRTTYGLLYSLLARERLLMWYLDVDESTTPHQIDLKVETLNKEPIDVDALGAEPIPVNTRLKHLIFDADQSARAVLKTSAVQKYDQVVAQGARRRSCFSLGFDDATLAVGWTQAQEGAYEDGASNATGFPAATEITERRKRHAEARSAEEVKDVYVRFTIPSDWDGKVGAGDDTTPLEPAFPIVQADGSIEAEPAAFSQVHLTVDQTLPLLEGVDYTGTKIEDGTVDESNSTGVERTPLVAWKLPHTSSPVRWQNVETIGRKADLEAEDPDEIQDWSCEVIVPPHDRGIRLHVHGEPQHIIAKTDFSGETEDDVIGDHDYRDMICTMSITEDRHAEGRYPGDTVISWGETGDLIRRKYIDVGDDFRQDYVCPQTIVDIDDDGSLLRTTEGGFIRDDTDKLETIARVAYLWYGQTRKVLALATERLTSEITRGDFIVEIGDDTAGLGLGHNIDEINSVVTEVRISTRRQESISGGGSPPDPPTMMITTGWGEMDPMQMIAPDKRDTGGPRPVDAVVSSFDTSRGA